jgi:hypothetical protein
MIFFVKFLSFTCILQIKSKVAETQATGATAPVVVDIESDDDLPALWGNWLTSMMPHLHSSVWLAYTTSSFERIMHFTF